MRSLIASVLTVFSSLLPVATIATAQEPEMQAPLPLTIDFATQGCGRFKQDAFYRTEFHFVNICRGEAGLIMVVTDNDGLGRERIPTEKNISSDGISFTGTSDRGIEYAINNQTFTILFKGQKPYQEQVKQVSFTGLTPLPSTTKPAIKPMSQPSTRPALLTATVTGNVTYRQRIALPPNAVVKVRLQDVSRADARAILLDEQAIPTNGKQVPIPFTLNYNPQQIQPNHTYAVSAQIWVDGNLHWVSTTQHPVITNGNPSRDITITMRQMSRDR